MKCPELQESSQLSGFAMISIQLQWSIPRSKSRSTALLQLYVSLRFAYHISVYYTNDC